MSTTKTCPCGRSWASINREADHIRSETGPMAEEEFVSKHERHEDNAADEQEERAGPWKSGYGEYPMADEIADIRGQGMSDYEWYGEDGR